MDTVSGNGCKVIGPAASGGSTAGGDFLYPSTDPNGNGGKFLVTGLKGFAIARYNANGTLDSTFGQNGIVSANFGSTLGTDDTISAVIQPDGKIDALGVSTDGKTAELARFNTNGTLNTSFGNGGMVTSSAFSSGLSGTLGMADPTGETTDDQIIVTGVAASGGGFQLARYNPDGTLDSTFGNGRDREHEDPGFWDLRCDPAGWQDRGPG